MNQTIQKNTQIVKKIAAEEGFNYCGISKAVFLETHAPKLENWLNKGHQAQMKWMENHFDKRLDPRLLVPGARSVVSLLLNYYPKEDKRKINGIKISKYALGKDYHKVIKNKLYSVLGKLESSIGEFNSRVFVDSAPVLERAWAEKSGLGWIGKNSMLINKSSGSFYFLAQIISDLELQVDGPIKDYCGTCTACIDSCPTDAILPERTLDSNKCISYLTIELKESIPQSFRNQMENWAFGCDICQDVCPWNRFSTPHKTDDFKPVNELFELSAVDWENLTKESYNKIFKHSAVKRTGFNGLKRNIEFLKME
ncbi:MAG: tRNA epoxyqueuosine(34) reductase QueG [Flavobacteriales bacterium]|nr:tRNA epoxyqueuosine(34) reductase QueG [Flavobacteriales bacterium]